MKPIHVNPPDAPTLDDALRPAARLDDPDTSHDAAAAQTDHDARERAILSKFALHGAMTDDELVAVSTGYAPTIKTARSRLSKAGLLVDSGQRRKSDRGRDMIVWRLR